MFFDNFGELEAVQLLDSKEMHILYQKKKKLLPIFSSNSDSVI